MVPSIQGSAGKSLLHLISLVHAGMMSEEFTDVVENIFDLVDPTDRESSLAEKTKARKNLIDNGHGFKKTFAFY